MRGPGDILRRSAATFGDKIALVAVDRTLTYRELDELTDRLAGGLRSLGVEPGQPVSLYGPNSWQWIVAYHGIFKAGAVVNPVNVMLTPEELAFVVSDCEAAAVFASARSCATVLEMAAEHPHVKAVISFGAGGPGALSFDELLRSEQPAPNVEVAPRDASTIGYTSGTTGHPKGAVQSHEAVLLNCALTATMHGRDERDVVVTALPAPHVYGNVVINGTFMVGGTVVLMERFDAARVLHLIEEFGATLFEGVPAMYSMLLDAPELPDADLSTLTRCTVGGQTIPLDVIERWQTRSGAPLIELWGMTEISGLGTTHSVHAPPVPGSIGVSLPGFEVRIADLEDPTREAAIDVPGEMLVRGPLVMLGYYGNPEATADVFEADGWLHTGDVARRAPSGHLFVVDRKKDMILTGGYNVYPAEVERVLSGHPAVAMVAVGPVSDRVKGELACAYVVPARDATVTAEELIVYARERMAAYKCPRQVVFVAQLPATSTGKIMRRELVKLHPG